MEGGRERPPRAFFFGPEFSNRVTKFPLVFSENVGRIFNSSQIILRLLFIFARFACCSRVRTIRLGPFVQDGGGEGTFYRIVTYLTMRRNILLFPLPPEYRLTPNNLSSPTFHFKDIPELQACFRTYFVGCSGLSQGRERKGMEYLFLSFPVFKY